MYKCVDRPIKRISYIRVYSTRLCKNALSMFYGLETPAKGKNKEKIDSKTGIEGKKNK